MTNDIEPNEEARTLAAELLERVSLDAAGEIFDEHDPSSWQVADDASVETIKRGPIRFKIVDADAVALAMAVGVIHSNDPAVLCLLVAVEQAGDAPEPSIGQFVVLPTGEPGVSLVFLVSATYADLHDSASPDLGPNASHNGAFDTMEPGQALLVQVFDAEDGDQQA